MTTSNKKKRNAPATGTGEFLKVTAYEVSDEVEAAFPGERERERKRLQEEERAYLEWRKHERERRRLYNSPEQVAAREAAAKQEAELTARRLQRFSSRFPD